MHFVSDIWSVISCVADLPLAPRIFQARIKAASYILEITAEIDHPMTYTHPQSPIWVNFKPPLQVHDRQRFNRRLSILMQVHTPPPHPNRPLAPKGTQEPAVKEIVNAPSELGWCMSTIATNKGCSICGAVEENPLFAGIGTFNVRLGTIYSSTLQGAFFGGCRVRAVQHQTFLIT
jgi:hypothetical protein